MFDKPSAKQAPPPVEDIFAGTDQVKDKAPTQSAAPVSPQVNQKQRPKPETESQPLALSQTPPALLEEGSGLKRKYILIGLAVLVVIGGGVVWVVFNTDFLTKKEPPQTKPQAIKETQDKEQGEVPQPPDNQPVTNKDQQTSPVKDSSPATTSNRFDLNVPLDQDADGLSDDEERSLGTDPLNPDTDQDGLYDFEEVNTWQTNPLNPDTDNDGFLDGQEVKNGYNPKGPGRLLELPAGQ